MCSHPHVRSIQIFYSELTWYYTNSCNGGTHSDNKLDWRVSFLRNLHFKGTHVILEKYPWYTMRSFVMVNGTFMILYWILVSIESTHKCIHFCWYNIHKILEQDGIYKLQIHTVIKNQYDIRKWVQRMCAMHLLYFPHVY